MAIPDTFSTLLLVYTLAIAHFGLFFFCFSLRVKEFSDQRLLLYNPDVHSPKENG